MTKHIIFDLDGTVIDSRHRAVSKADGSFCLDGWRVNCTPELIAKDTLLPLAETMRRYFQEGKTVIVCTARVFSPADFEFLARHKLRYDYIIHRDPSDMRGDADYKRERLNDLARELGYDSLKDMGALMFDDNLSVIKEMICNRVVCFNAIGMNNAIVEGLPFCWAKNLETIKCAA